VRLGLVPRVTRRLTGHERSMIRPGTVWVWEEGACCAASVDSLRRDGEFGSMMILILEPWLMVCRRDKYAEMDRWETMGCFQSRWRGVSRLHRVSRAAVMSRKFVPSRPAYRALRCARSREGWRGVGRGDVDLYSRRRGLWHWG
jgi:hypothetical protein